jgi:uncharacterized membrane protein
MRTKLSFWSALTGLLAGAACSTGPAPPAPGSAAYYWNAAGTTYRTGDLVKTSQNLQEVSKTQSEFTSRARPWAIVLTAGLAQGYADAADAYEAGARANRANPMPFRKEASQLRSLASAADMELAETVHVFLTKQTEPTVPLPFDRLTGSAAEPPAFRKIFAGAWLQDSERELFLQSMLQRGVLFSASRAAGSPDDSAKALEILKGGDAQRPRAEFLFGIAKALYDQSALFGSTKLDQPNRLRLLCQEALECLQAGPETKESKALAAKIQAVLKKIKVST